MTDTALIIGETLAGIALAAGALSLTLPSRKRHEPAPDPSVQWEREETPAEPEPTSLAHADDDHEDVLTLALEGYAAAPHARHLVVVRDEK